MSIFRRTVYAGIIIGLVLWILEVSLSMTGVVPLYQQTDPFIGFSSHSNLFVKHPLDDGSYRVELAPDKTDRFNRIQFSHPKPHNTIRVFCLGGSTTFGRPFDQNTAFCRWLEDFLRATAPDQHWETINLGGISYASYRIAALMPQLAEFQPDLFILYSGHNEFLEDRSYREIVDMPAWLRDLSVELGRSRIYSVMKSGFDRLSTAHSESVQNPSSISDEVDEILAHSVGLESYQRDDKRAQHIRAHFQYNIRRIIRLAKSYNSEVLLIQPAAKMRQESPFKSEHKSAIKKPERVKFDKLVSQGITDFNRQQFEQALASFDQALTIDDRFAELHFIRGNALFEMQQYQAAKKAYQHSIDEDVAPLRITSDLHKELAQIAIDTQTELIDFPSLISNLSTLRYGHDLPGQEMFLDHVHPTIELHKELGLAVLRRLQNLGMVPLTPLSDSEISAIYDKRLSGLDRQSQRNALLNLVKILGWSGKLDEAHQLLLRIQKDFGNSPLTLKLLSMSYEKTGRPTEALEIARFAVESYPDNYMSQESLAILLKTLNMNDQAIDRYQKALEINPRAMNSHQSLVELLIENGRRVEAIDHLERVSQLNPDNAIVHLNLGMLYGENGEFDLAEKSLNRVLELDSENASAYSSLALIAERQQHIQKALIYYEKAQKLDPDNPQIANNFGVLLARSGRIEAAIKQFKQALEMSPEFDQARRNLDTALNQSIRP